MQTISSPGASARPAAAENAIVSAVMLGPNATPRGSAPSMSATAPRASSTTSPDARACGNAPPSFAVRPERIQSVMASIALSTICVPPGPSRRAQPSARPGKRSRFT